jgi:hypothetical protein
MPTTRGGPLRAAIEFFYGFANRLFERGMRPVASLEEILLDQVRDNFGIGFGRKLVAFFNQFLFEAEIVFYDSVVYHDNLAGAVAVRMRIFFRRSSVGGPASVADSVTAMQRLKADYFFQVAKFSFGPANL